MGGRGVAERKRHRDSEEEMCVKEGRHALGFR
ncbi:hypothetical protein A2U01_0070213, partial [Trifolium medium]|nr:hypothetical protein [Trifolium medium]